MKAVLQQQLQQMVHSPRQEKPATKTATRTSLKNPDSGEEGGGGYRPHAYRLAPRQGVPLLVAFLHVQVAVPLASQHKLLGAVAAEDVA